MDIESAIREAQVRLAAQELDAYEVAVLIDQALVVEAKGQRVDRWLRTTNQGLAIRAVRGGRLGFAATTEINARAVHQAAKAALAALKVVAPSAEAVLPSPQSAEGRLDEPASTPLDQLPDEAKIDVAMTLESTAMAADSRIRRVQHPRYEEARRRMIVVNNHGVAADASRAICSCELKVVADAGAAPESAYDFDYGTAFTALDPAECARRAARRALAKLGAERISGGALPVLFDQRAASCLVKLLASSFFAESIQRGKSLLAGKRGERYYHPLVTVVDDGLLPGGIASFPFDGEGIPRRRTLLIRDGIIESWLYDGARASRDGVHSTGSCLRESIHRLPVIGVSNCFLKPGSATPEAVARQMGNGVLITDLLGVHTANAVSGAFSLGAEGFVVSGGVAAAPFRGVTVAGNVHEVFKRVAAVGSDLRFFGSCGSPSMLVEGLMVSG